MKTTSPAWKQLTKSAPLFAALGDETRLSLILQLGEGNLVSITQLSEGRPQSRQAIRKHLQILEDARLVRGVRRGRENLFQLKPESIATASQTLTAISQQWDDALARLKSFVED